MTTIQVLMPMGGLGERFKKAGFSTPKPLIEVDGMPMFKRALASLEVAGIDTRLIVVVREDADRDYGLGGLVRQAHPAAEIVLLARNTRGAVETALEATAVLDPTLPLLIMDCDIAFESRDYFAAIDRAVRTGLPKGLLLSFTSEDPRYSYARLDAAGCVEETAEKRPISTNALMGAYFFTEARTFLTAAEELMLDEISAEMPEYYLSLVFNRMLRAGLKVGLARGDFYSFGTPEELARYEQTGEPT